MTTAREFAFVPLLLSRQKLSRVKHARSLHAKKLNVALRRGEWKYEKDKFCPILTTYHRVLFTIRHQPACRPVS
jgi:hypothetical protein